MIWKRPDIIERLLPNVDLDEVNRVRTERSSKLKEPNWGDLPDFIQSLPEPHDLVEPYEIDFASDQVTIGDRKKVSNNQFEQIKKTVERLQPWRKGPFNLFGIEIDAEWKSNLKWSRIESVLGDLRSRKIIDVGCGNGYYMFRAMAQQPDLVLGLDPSAQFYYMFELFQRYLRNPNLQYELLGFEHLKFFQDAFDVALCMGVLYHHRSPIEILRDLKQTLKIGGFAIIESQSIDSEGSIALFPEGRYAKARNVFLCRQKIA